MKLNELLPAIPLKTCIIFRNMCTFRESDPEILEGLLKLDSFLKDSKDYEVEGIWAIATNILRIDIIFSKED